MSKPTPETDAACPYCKAMPMGMVAKVRWTCGSYGGPTGRSEQCKERANAWEQRDEAGKELSSIHRWIERNHADGFIDSLTYLQNLERVTDSWHDRIDAIETDARRFVRERDEAREENEKLHDIVERAINYLNQSYRYGFADEIRDLLYEIEQLKKETK